MEGGGAPTTVPLARFGRSHIWVRSEQVSRKSSLSYTFNESVYEMTDNGEAISNVWEMTDDLNPLATPNGASLICFLPPLPYSTFSPAGQLPSWSVRSMVLGSSRTLTLYLPNCTKAEQCRGLVIFFDGEAFCLGWPEAELGPYIPTPQILDTLVRQNLIPPIAAAFISVGTSRDQDLVLSCRFADAIADEFLPFIFEQLHIEELDPANICLAGASFGGLCATFTSLKRPDNFGNALCMSASFWVGASEFPHDPTAGAIQTLVRDSDRKKVKFSLEAGVYEGPDIVGTNRHVRDLLMAKGYEVSYREYAATHDYVHWQIALPDGLIAICQSWR